MKLMLFLSHNGILSRRKAFEAIKDGAVTVNGTVDREPSRDVDPSRDQIDFHGRSINNRIFEYVILNKPEDYVTTCATQFEQRTVMDLLPKELKHLRPVGRLDKDTEGLLLFTNDGELANQLAHPAFDVDKTYFARVKGLVTPEVVAQFEEGIILDNRRTSPARVEVLSAREDVSEIQITIHEGRKHQVRLMADAVGHGVIYLKRLRQGPLELGFLRSGEWRRLTEEEASRLKSIKRSVNPNVKAAGKKEFRPWVPEKQYAGRRGRGEFNRDVRRDTERPRSAAPRDGERRPPASRTAAPRDTGRRPARPDARKFTPGPSSPRREYSSDQRRSESSRSSTPREGDRRPARPDARKFTPGSSSPRREYSGDQRRSERPRPYSSREGERRPPRPEYSSREGHRSTPRPAASLKPLFQSHSEKRRFSSTREWHSDSDVHAPKKAPAADRPVWKKSPEGRGARPFNKTTGDSRRSQR